MSPSCQWADSERGAVKSWQSLIENKGKLFNCFSINKLVGQKYLKKRTETSAKRREFSAIESIHFATSCLSPMDTSE